MALPNKTDADRMGVAPVGKLLTGMAVPMIVSMLVQALYNVVDSIFVSRISAVDDNALTAVSLSFPLQSLMIAFATGTAMGMNALISRSLGEKNQDRADRTACTGIFLILINWILFALIGAFLAEPFFGFQIRFSPDRSAEEAAAIIRYGVQYVRICLIGSVGLFSQFCFERLLQATGRTGLSMIAQLVGAGTNLILDPILIFGFHLDVAGAAIATVTGQVLAAVTAFLMNLKFNRDLHLSFRLVRWNGGITRRIYKIGLPSIVMQAVGSVMIFLFNLILIPFGAEAAFGIYFKLQSFVFMPIFGLNNAMVPIIAYNYGANRHDRVTRTIRLSILIAEGMMLLGVLLFELFPGVLLGFFSPTELTEQIGVTALRVIAPHFLPAGVSIVCISVCQAIGNPFHSLIVAVCRQIVVLLPAAWLLSQLGRIELVWLAFPIAELVSLALCLVFLFSALKKSRARQGELT